MYEDSDWWDSGKNSGYTMNFGNNSPVNQGIGTGYGDNSPDSALNDFGGIPGTGGGGAGAGIDWGKAFDYGSKGLGAVGSLGNLYLGYKQYQLGKDNLKFNKNVTNRNLANQAKTTNAEIARQARSRLSGSGKYRGDAAGLESALKSYNKENFVSGERIG